MFKVTQRLQWLKSCRNTIRELVSTFGVSRDFAEMYLQPADSTESMVFLMNCKLAIDISTD